MGKRSTAGALLGMLLLLSAPGAAWATLIGQTITVTFSEAGFADEVDLVPVGDGQEIVFGDATNIGGSILNVGELVDVGVLSVEFVIRGDGEVHSPGFQTAGFGADARYVLTGLDFSPLRIGGVSVTTENIVGVALGSEVLFSPDSLTFIVGTLGVGEIAEAPDLGTVMLDLELVPEPNAGLLLGAALAGLGLVRFFPPTMLSELTHSDFAGRLHQTFRVALDSSTIELELITADELGPAPEEGRRVPFSVVFRGPQEPILPQRIYRLEHPEMGILEVFLVPIGPDNEGQRYELVFS